MATKKAPSGTLYFHDSKDKERFEAHKKEFDTNADYSEALLNAFENQPKDESGDVVYLSPEKKKFFHAKRKRERDAWENVPEYLGRENLEMTDCEFLKIISEVTGMSEQDILSKAIQSYGQGTIAKLASGFDKALGAKDDEITGDVKKMLGQFQKDILPENLRKLGYTTIFRFTGRNVETLKGWAKRNDVSDLIDNQSMTQENVKEFLSRI